MENVKKILRNFSELRGTYSNIETAVEMVCVGTKLDRAEVLGVLVSAGVFVLPDSTEENNIKLFISSADRNKIAANELAKEVGFRFCICSKEAERLVAKFN